MRRRGRWKITCSFKSFFLANTIKQIENCSLIHSESFKTLAVLKVKSEKRVLNVSCIVIHEQSKGMHNLTLTILDFSTTYAY